MKKKMRPARIGQAAIVVVAALMTAGTAEALPPVRLLDGAIGCSSASEARHLQEAMAHAKGAVIEPGSQRSCRDFSGYWARVIAADKHMVFATVSYDRLGLDPKSVWIPISFVAKAAVKQGLIAAKP